MKKDKRTYIGFGLLCLGIAAWAYGGLCTAESDTVLQKAVSICLECIGIG